MKKIATCRACGSKALTPAFSISLANERSPLGLRSKRGSLDYVFCDPSQDAFACGLLQKNTLSAAEYSEVIPSGRYRSTRNSLRKAATEALESISGRDCRALDIGCNDGTLLSFYPRWVDRVGIDSDAVIDEIGDWAQTVQARFPSEETRHALAGDKFDLITAISVLEELDDPKSFFESVKELLVDDGVLVVETLYAPVALTRNAIESLHPGISAAFSLAVIERIVRDADLKIFRGALTEKEGGSIRLFITHAESEEYDFDPWYERLARLWDEENALAMRALQPYQAFEQRLMEAREAFSKLLNEIADRGERIHILGADIQAQTLLAWAGASATQTVSAAVGMGCARAGERLGSDGPPIITETDCRAAEPEYLIAPARMKREMLERWRETILIGGKLIFATPSPVIVTSANYAAEFGKALALGDGPGGVETLRTILHAAGGLRLIADRGGRTVASG
ncbi:MAG: methyltransferase domain-containing protein [Parvularculaceae bacterium]